MFMKFKPFNAPARYEFTDPDTGYLYEAKTEEDLIALIVSTRKLNGLAPLEELPLVIENYLCTQPINRGACKPNKLHRSLSAYIKGGIALLKNLYYGEASLVPQITADARSTVCKSCPFNSFPDKGPFLEWSDNIALSCVGEHRASNHEDLGSCTVCSCLLKAKVWFRGPFDLTPEQKSTILEKKPDCWQL